MNRSTSSSLNPRPIALSEAFSRKALQRLIKIYCRTASRTSSLRDLRSWLATASRSVESSGGRDMDKIEDFLGIKSPLYYRLILIDEGVKRMKCLFLRGPWF